MVLISMAAWITDTYPDDLSDLLLKETTDDSDSESGNDVLGSDAESSDGSSDDDD